MRGSMRTPVKMIMCDEKWYSSKVRQNAARCDIAPMKQLLLKSAAQTIAKLAHSHVHAHLWARYFGID